jgi:hypothetical protein
MSVRAYDPTLGRFISRDPLGRAPLMGWTDQPYAYAGNNPLVNVDPSGQRFMAMDGAGGTTGGNNQQTTARVVNKNPCGTKKWCPAHMYDQYEFRRGLGQFILGFIIVAGVVAAYLVPGGLGFALNFFFHDQLNSGLHYLLGGTASLWEGIFGPLSKSDKAWYDVLALISDLVTMIVTFIDLKAAVGKVKSVGQFVKKAINLFKHGWNKALFQDFLGDLGGLFQSTFPQALTDYLALRRDSRAAWGWNLPGLGLYP